MSGYYHDGLIFGIVVGKSFLAVSLIILGVLVIRCGFKTCWLRFGRRSGDKPLS